jgi:hypothetical protein
MKWAWISRSIDGPSSRSMTPGTVWIGLKVFVFTVSRSWLQAAIRAGWSALRIGSVSSKNGRSLR